MPAKELTSFHANRWRNCRRAGAFASGAKGRWFESTRAYQKINGLQGSPVRPFHQPFINKPPGSAFERRFPPFFITERSKSATALCWFSGMTLT